MNEIAFHIHTHNICMSYTEALWVTQALYQNFPVILGPRFILSNVSQYDLHKVCHWQVHLCDCA